MAGESIEVSRQNLFETRFVASSALRDLEQVHIQYERKVAEMREMTAKFGSLHKELEESQKTTSNYRSAFEEYKRRASENENRIKDLEGRRVEAAKQIQIAIDRDTSARRMIDELENEREDLIQGHRAAISVMVARECLAEQRIDELQEGADILTQEHQATMNITVGRMNSAEQKVEEFRKIIGTFEHWEVDSTCPTPEQSPGAVKRPRSETIQQRGRPSKHRKCKDATKMGDEDTIVVRN